MEKDMTVENCRVLGAKLNDVQNAMKKEKTKSSVRFESEVTILESNKSISPELESVKMEKQNARPQSKTKEKGRPHSGSRSGSRQVQSRSNSRQGSRPSSRPNSRIGSSRASSRADKYVKNFQPGFFLFYEHVYFFRKFRVRQPFYCKIVSFS